MSGEIIGNKNKKIKQKKGDYFESMNWILNTMLSYQKGLREGLMQMREVKLETYGDRTG